MPDFAKILVPIDFSPPSTRALDFAIDFAKRFGASLELLHVEQPIGTPVSPSYMPPILNLESIAAAARAHCQQQLGEAAQRARTAGVSAVTTKLLAGAADLVVPVGPAGGWTAVERAAVESRVGLGPTVVRTETAALAVGVLFVTTRAARVSD